MNSKRRLLDDCFLHDKDRLRHADAVAILQERLLPIAGIEQVALSEAHGRILARDVLATADIPSFTNAAVDGYAMSGTSLGPGETRLEVTMRITAGSPADKPLPKGTAARIFTGAVMPEGADTCVMQEDITTDDGHILVPPGAKTGINTRAAGEDVKCGETVVASGTSLRPQELAAIASTGCGAIDCFKPLKVALVSTGDELLRPGGTLQTGQVFDSNHYLLKGLLDTLQMDVRDYGILPDEKSAVLEAIRDARSACDVILTTGGASRGESDFIVETIQELGRLHAWQLAIKPGRPLAFGQIEDTVFLGLPGNPVAVLVCFLLYARPAIISLQGAAWREPQRFPLPAGFEIRKKKPDRREFWRGWIDNSGAAPRLQKFDKDGSALISGMRRATGLIEVAEEVTSVATGDMLNFIPFSEFGLPPH